MMESLPEEMVVAVAKYLEVKDLFTCCIVSRGWRGCFNQDSVWKPLCDVEMCEHLEATRSVVEPCFTPPPVLEGKTLRSLCRWGVNFLRQNHLLNNWRQGRSVLQVIRVEDSFLNLSFLTNDLIVRLEDNSIAVWDVREMDPNGNPRKFNPVHLLPHWKVDSCTALTPNKMVIVQYRLVYIFNWSTTSDQWSLNYMFLVNEPEKITVNNLVDYDDSHLRGEEKAFMRYIIAGNHFLGFIKDEDKFHVWDLVRGEKVKEEKIPLGRLISFKRSTTSRNVVVVTVELGTEPKINFYIYNLVTLLFLTFKVTYDFGKELQKLDYYLNDKFNVMDHDYSCAIHGKYVALRFDGKLEIFDYHTSDCLVTVKQCHFGPQIMKSRFVFNCYGTLSYSRNNKSYSIMDSLVICDPAKSHKKITSEYNPEFLVINDRFYLCSKVDHSEDEAVYNSDGEEVGSIDICNISNVWEITQRKKSLKGIRTKTKLGWRPQFIMEVNKAFSRLIQNDWDMYNGHLVYHMWTFW